MSDLSGLPPPRLARAASLASIQSVTVRLIALPDSLKNNLKSLSLTATVSGRNSDGSITLDTDHGSIAILLRDRGNLPNGAKIEIEIPAGRPPMAAAIHNMSAETQAMPKTAASVETSLFTFDRPIPIDPEVVETAVSSALGQSLSKAVALLPDQLMRILPLPPAEAAKIAKIDLTLLSNFAAQLVDDAVITKVEAQDFALPLTAGKSPILPGSDSVPASTSLLSESGQPIVFKNISDLVPAEKVFGSKNSLDLKILAFQPAANASLTTSHSLPDISTSPIRPLPILAQVVGLTPNGQPIVSVLQSGNSMGGLFVMQFSPDNLEIGSNLAFVPVNAGQAGGNGPASGLSSPILNSDDLSVPGLWNSLQDILNLSALGGDGRISMAQLLPSTKAPHQFGALASFFIALIRNGDPELLLTSKSSSILRSSRHDLLKQIAAEFSVAAQTEMSGQQGDWKLLTMPLLHEQQVHRLPVYYRQWFEDNSENAVEVDRKVTRFLFQLDLSRMGNVQVDGFMRSKNLDMILRTRAPIGPAMQSTVRQLYATAMGRSNLTGEIMFQSKPEQWVNP